MSYYKDENGIECFNDEEYGNLYVKNKQGRLYIVNRTKAFAKRHKLKVIYVTSDGKTIIRPAEGQRRRINKKIKRERELEEAMNLWKWNGILQLMKDGKCLSDEESSSSKRK